MSRIFISAIRYPTRPIGISILIRFPPKMSATRTSSRQAAQKAKEAISDTNGKPGAGVKRRVTTDKGPAAKRGKKAEQEAEPEVKEEKVAEPETKPGTAEGAPAKEKQPAAAKAPEEKPQIDGIEAGVRKSQEREDIVPTNIFEKGIIYFFYRPRVSVTEAHGVNEVARSFVVLRPTPRGATLDEGQGPLEADAKCRLIVLPKKKFPTSGSERDMAFVEKAGQSMKQLQESFITGRSYETATRGEREVSEAKPYAEGVYAIMHEARSSHLAYILTIPEEIGDLQKDFGLRDRGSWVVQSKNPKFPGPAYATLPKDPEYPEHLQEKLGNMRWIPLEPELIDYPNAQFLMIGSAQDNLGRAASTGLDGKKPEQEQPGEELEKMESENEHRVDALKGDHTVYEDLGLEAKKYPKVPSTWNNQA